MRVTYFISLLLLPMLVHAQLPGTEYTRVLLPVVVENPIPGAFGSQWTTHLTVVSDAPVPVSIYGYNWPCSLPGCLTTPPRIPAGATFRPDAGIAGHASGFLAVELEHLADVRIVLRAQDLSRQTLTWGTQLPTPTEDEFRRDRISLADIPTGQRFRTTLRVYSTNATASVRIRVYGTRPLRSSDLQTGIPAADALLSEQDVTLAPSTRPALQPAMAQLDYSLPDITDYETVRLEIAPRDGEPIWAFGSVTHNETQHLTIIAP